MTTTTWHKFSKTKLPPEHFLLIYVEFDSPANPGARPRILKGYYDREHDYWATPHGKLSRGRVTHWCLLPPAPEVSP